MSELSNNISEIELAKQRLEIQEKLAVKKALESEDPDAIIKANAYLKDVQTRTQTNSKSFLFDPFETTGNLGYKDKPYQLSYQTLAKMAKVPMVGAVILTRQDQIAAFSEPQTDRYSTGFQIRKKIFGQGNGSQQKVTTEDQRKIQYLTEFILNGGSTNNSWHADDFDTFLRKIAYDSLRFDQATFEVVRNRRGVPIEFFAVDASTFRVADSYDDETYAGTPKEAVNGYFPSYVQIYNSLIKAEFYPWELCFGVRNPNTSVYSNGYGQSELEILIHTITAMLYADEYNRRFFSTGSAPKGILKVTGQINQGRLDEFRQQWMSQVAGVSNAWRTPIIEGEKMDWIDLQKSNTDMQFSEYYKFMIQVVCAIYKIDPSEVGFNLNSGQSIFEGNNEAKLAYSKDKGLKPILKFIQRKINKYIINPIDPSFEFIFAGLETDTAANELEMDIKSMTNFMTINEIRIKRGLKPIGSKGDIIANAQYMQAEQIAMQGDPNSNEAMDQMDGEDPADEDENPFMKGVQDYINQLAA